MRSLSPIEMNAFQPQAIRASTHFQHIELGPHFTLRYLMAKATQSCLYSKYEDCWLHFCRDNDLVEALAAQLSEAELDGLMVTEAENRIVASPDDSDCAPFRHEWLTMF